MRSATTAGCTLGAARLSAGMPMACCGAAATPGRTARWWAGRPHTRGGCSWAAQANIGGGALAPHSRCLLLGIYVVIGACGLPQALCDVQNQVSSWTAELALALQTSWSIHGSHFMVPMITERWICASLQLCSRLLQ